MSRKIAWESGAIRVPVAEWKAIKTVVRNAWNDHQGRTFANAQRVRDLLLVAGYRKRQFDWYGALESALAKAGVLDWDHDAIGAALFAGNSRRPRNPQRGQFPMAPARQTVFNFGIASFQLDDLARTLLWEVPKADHGPGRARHHPIAVAVFRQLADITARGGWTSQSGGVITGNDELNRAPDGIRAGADYVVESFGPARRRVAVSGSPQKQS